MKNTGIGKLCDAIVMDEYEMSENCDIVIVLPIMVIDQIRTHIDYISVVLLMCNQTLQ